jgi:charged multivesicular body protein 6
MDPGPSAQDKAVWDLKIQRDKLQQYQKQIQHVIEKEIEIARKLLKEKKREKAKLVLKKVFLLKS